MAREKTGIAPATPVSKLRAPRVRHAEVPRTNLLTDTRLSDCEVVTLCAPAGYGKSTLAIQWAAASDRPIAWATLDEADADPVVLITTISTALAHAAPGYVPPPPITADGSRLSLKVLPEFAAAVSSINAPTTVVLDDIHLAESPHTRKILKVLVDALPIGSQVCLVGRTMQVAPLALWRGQGCVAELRVEELAFTQLETDAAVTAFGDQREPAGVYAASHGWPVAVFLLSQTPSASSLTNIYEFIQDEVLMPMPAEQREFVMATAPLGSICPELAGRVTGSSRAAHFLAEAITTVLIAPAESGWYRYHPLLQEAAVDLWEREDPDGLARIHAAAARWLLESGFHDQAVAHAIRSRDAATQGEVLWPAARLALLQGRTQTVLTWLDRLGLRAVDAHPALSMTAAWAHVAAGDYGHVLRHTQQTLHQMPSDWLTHPGDFTIAPHLTLLMAVSHAGLESPAEALEIARVSRAITDPDDPILALSTTVLGFNMALNGDPAAQVTFEEAAALAEAAGISSTHAEALALLGLLLMAQGQETAGCDRVEQALEIYAFNDLTEMTSTAGILLLATVALTAFRGRPADVHAAIQKQATVAQEVEKILGWYRSLSGGVLAFASVRIGDNAAYHQYVRWCRGEALCRWWVAKADQEYAAASPLAELTPAELRVWELLKGRMTLSEIAGALFLSRETVKSHTGSIYRKLGVASRRQAQELAESWG